MYLIKHAIVRYACSLFIGLEPYTWYDIYVQPFYRNAVGASSTIVRERTSQDGRLFQPFLHTAINNCFYVQLYDLSTQRVSLLDSFIFYYFSS